MPIKTRITDKEAVFECSKEAMDRIKQWQQETDEKLFMAQIEEDSELSLSAPHIVERMKNRFNKEGIKKPYYGAAGGAYSIEFGFKDAVAFVRSVNGMTKESFEILNNNEPLTASDNGDLLSYRLSKEEMTKFNAWRQTEEGQGNLEDYVFSFWSASLGGGVIIRNMRSSAELNTINYDDW